MSQPFKGVLVLDATHVLAGPTCGYQIALLGADVIKIESPRDPDPVRRRGTSKHLNDAGMGLNYLAQNSNKRSLSLDLKTAKGKEVFLKLAAKADVIIENFRSGALAALGLGYEEIRAFNPKVVYCSLTGFGQTGPHATRLGLDPVVQGLTGVMEATGHNDRGPMKSGSPFVDYATGMTGAFAVAAALYQRQATGHGQRIDVAMTDVSLAFMGPLAMTGAYRGPQYRHPREPGTDVYRTKDGWLQLGAYSFRHNERLWNFFGNDEFAVYKSWPEIWDNGERMRVELARHMLDRTAAEWETLFFEIGIPAAKVRTVDEALELPHIKERGLWVESPAFEGSEGVHVPSAPYKFDHDGPAITRRAPALGEHNEEILTSLGYSSQQIADMRREAVF